MARGEGRLLSKAELGGLVVAAHEASVGGSEGWSGLERRLRGVQATLSFPLGELMNPDISGFVIGWNVMGRIGKPQRIEKSDRFNAQGLEGKIVIPMPLIEAVMAAQHMDPNRVNVRVFGRVP